MPRHVTLPTRCPRDLALGSHPAAQEQCGATSVPSSGNGARAKPAQEGRVLKFWRQVVTTESKQSSVMGNAAGLSQPSLLFCSHFRVSWGRVFTSTTLADLLHRNIFLVLKPGAQKGGWGGGVGVEMRE